MTLATIEADIKEVAEKVEVEADHLANLVRTGLHNLLALHKEDPAAVKDIVKDAQPVAAVGNETTVSTGGAETTAG